MKNESEWNIETASLSHSQRGTFIDLNERPLWAVAAEMIGENLVSATGHLLCCNIPEWAFKLRWGPLDGDGWTDKNIGHYMYMLGQWTQLGFGAWRQSRHIGKLPVTTEWVQEHYPDAGWPWDGSSIDEMRSTPEDGLTTPEGDSTV